MNNITHYKRTPKILSPYYISFGSNHNHLVLGHTLGVDYLVCIKAHSHAEASAIAFSLFDDKFCAIYNTEQLEKSPKLSDNIILNLPEEANLNTCSTCSTPKPDNIPLHCPYQLDVNNKRVLCQCCEECRTQCAMDI